MSATAKLYRTIVGALIFVIVAVQCWQVIGDKSGAALFAAAVNFFSFFTILTNLIAGAALLVPALWPQSRAGQFLLRPSVRTAIAAYIIIVGIVYLALLHGVSGAQGLRLVMELALHYVTPPLYVLDWILFVPKRNLDWRVGLASLGYPIAYAIWTLVHGAATGWYPYAFVDVGDLGLARAAVNATGLFVAYLVLAGALAELGRWFATRDAPSG
jgi:hypothetical protein